MVVKRRTRIEGKDTNGLDAKQYNIQHTSDNLSPDDSLARWQTKQNRDGRRDDANS